MLLWFFRLILAQPILDGELFQQGFFGLLQCPERVYWYYWRQPCEARLKKCCENIREKNLWIERYWAHMCRPNEAIADRSCRADLVALFQLFKGGFLLGECRTFARTLFLQLRLPLSFALRIQQKLGWQLINIDFAEDRASGPSLFRRRALSFFRERLFFLSFVFFSYPKFWLSRRFGF